SRQGRSRGGRWRAPMGMGRWRRAGCALHSTDRQGTPMNSSRPFAIVTGASSGIGLALAREAAIRGYDLLIAADRSLDDQAAALRAHGATVVAVETDLA